MSHHRLTRPDNEAASPPAARQATCLAFITLECSLVPTLFMHPLQVKTHS